MLQVDGRSSEKFFLPAAMQEKHVNRPDYKINAEHVFPLRDFDVVKCDRPTALFMSLDSEANKFLEHSLLPCSSSSSCSRVLLFEKLSLPIKVLVYDATFQDFIDL
jgi:hypothetical protein